MWTALSTGLRAFPFAFFLLPFVYATVFLGPTAVSQQPNRQSRNLTARRS